MLAAGAGGSNGSREPDSPAPDFDTTCWWNWSGKCPIHPRWIRRLAPPWELEYLLASVACLVCDWKQAITDLGTGCRRGGVGWCCWPYLGWSGWTVAGFEVEHRGRAPRPRPNKTAKWIKDKIRDVTVCSCPCRNKGSVLHPIRIAHKNVRRKEMGQVPTQLENSGYVCYPPCQISDPLFRNPFSPGTHARVWPSHGQSSYRPGLSGRSSIPP